MIWESAVLGLECKVTPVSRSIAAEMSFGCFAQVLMNVGLLWVTASVYQMMRGAEMIFAAGLGIVFLKRHLNRWHFGGILCCVVS